MPPGFCADAAPTQHRAPSSTAATTLCLFPFTRVLPPLSIARDEPSGPFIWRLPVEPEVLEARAVVDAVDHVGEALHLRLPAGRNAAVEDDRPRVLANDVDVDLDPPDRINSGLDAREARVAIRCV